MRVNGHLHVLFSDMLAFKLTSATLLLLFGCALLWNVSRRDAARAWLGILLLVNALLVVGGSGVVGAWLSPQRSPYAFTLFIGSFLLSPLLLRLALDRFTGPQPLCAQDLRALWPAPVLVGALSIAYVAWPGSMYAGAAGWWVALGALHGFALIVFAGMAARLPKASTRQRVLFGVFALHWSFSAASGVVAVAGWSGGAMLEGASVGTLLIFGLAAAALGVHTAAESLPSFVEPPTVPDADRTLSRRLRALLEEERLYLDSDLTLETLATRAGADERDVSRVLGSVLGGGYHDVIGRFRVRHAQRLLLEKPEATILEVLYAAGFNSKSAFHRAFREHMGATPSAYRRDAAASARSNEETRGDGAVDGVPTTSGTSHFP